jgi:hypothetical protein
MIPKEKVNNRESSSDALAVNRVTECDWEVFVIRRDPESGTFTTLTACCDDALDKQ